MRFFSQKKAGEIPKTVSLSQPVEQSAMGYRTAALQGIGRREEQQDSYVVINGNDVIAIKKSGLFAVVADGMGGMKGGAEASSLVIQKLSETFAKLNGEENIPLQLYQAIQTANQAIYEKLRGTGGSTVVACLLYQGKLYFASVGDSGLHLLRKGKLCRLNREQNALHKAYLETVCAGSMDPSYANSLSEKQALSQFVGMRQLEDVDILFRPLAMETGDVLLLCSDGIDGILSEEELTDCLSSGEAQEICTRLEAGIIRENNMYQDNYTAIIIQCRL